MPTYDSIVTAAFSGDRQDVEHHLASGVDINTRNRSGQTALMMAASAGHMEIVKLLLKRGADISIQDDLRDGNPRFTAYEYAGRNGNTEVVKTLLETSPNVDATSPGGWTALMRASLNGYTDTVKLLLGKGAWVNRKSDDLGATALMLASKTGHADIVKILLDKEADLNAKDKFGCTALQYALDNDYTDVAELLIKGNIDPNATIFPGKTGLMFAVTKGYTNIVRLLLDKGASVKGDPYEKRPPSCLLILRPSSRCS